MSEIIIKTENAVIRQQKNTILKNVNLEIKSGEFIYIIGKVGSGKSSFLKTLYAELPLEYGKAEVAGFQLKKIRKSQIPLLRRKCGIVFQDFKLLTDRNVRANLEFVLKATGWNNKKAIRERIDLVLQKVEMSDKKEKMPHELSGGEQQRIVLARALLNAPPIIFADEPTGNIDPETSYRLIELLKDICDNGKTVIIATHQYDLIERYPGRVLRCEDGTLTEDPELSVHPQTTLPTDTENIENIPFPEEVTENDGLPAVLEADIQTPQTEDNNLNEQPQTLPENLSLQENISPSEETHPEAGLPQLPESSEAIETVEPVEISEQLLSKTTPILHSQETMTEEKESALPAEQEKQEPEAPLIPPARNPVAPELPEITPDNNQTDENNITGHTEPEHPAETPENEEKKKEDDTPPPVFGFELID